MSFIPWHIVLFCKIIAHNYADCLITPLVMLLLYYLMYHLQLMTVCPTSWVLFGVIWQIWTSSHARIINDFYMGVVLWNKPTEPHLEYYFEPEILKISQAPRNEEWEVSCCFYYDATRFGSKICRCGQWPVPTPVKDVLHFTRLVIRYIWSLGSSISWLTDLEAISDHITSAVAVNIMSWTSAAWQNTLLWGSLSFFTYGRHEYSAIAQ
jgi:hypothetical protein